MMYIPDPIELREARCERWAEDNVKDKMFKCSCGKWCDIGDGGTISPDPYAIPICCDCFEEWLNMQKEKNADC